MLRTTTRRSAASVVAAAGAIALGLGVAAPASATTNPDGTVTIDLVGITDLHGALATMPNIAAQVTAFRDANDDTVFVSAGDSIGGSTFESAVDQDFPTLDLLDAAGLQASAVGNHEFDQGFADITDRVQPDVEFPYLGANVIDVDTNEPALPPFTIITTASGVDIAFIGTVTQQTPTVVSPGGVEGLRFDDPVAVTNQYADLLSNGIDTSDDPEADVVVALAHEATAVIAPGLNANVDAAFTGHSHENTTARTPSNAPVVQAEAAGTELGHIRLTLATDGSVTSQAAENLPVTAMTAAEIAATTPLPDASYDSDSVAIVRQAFRDAQTLGAQRVGSIGAPFNAASTTGASNGTGTPSNRGAESPLNNLLAEVYAETVREFGIEADFGIMNPGGVRKDLDQDGDGIITYREAFNVTPFGNTVGTIDLTAAQVDTLLEQQFEARAPRPMLALGLSPELTYIYDPAAPIGDRIDEIFLDGAPLDPSGTFTVASNTFLLEGADGFTVLAEGTNLQETGVVDATAFQDFLAARDDVDAPADERMVPTYQQQSIGVTPVTPLDGTFAPGDEITVDLSSLSFTTTEPKPQEVVALIPPAEATVASLATAALDAPAAAPGTVLATVPVDNTISIVPSVPVGDAPVPSPDPGQGSNETGRASVTVTIPEDTEAGAFTVRYQFSPEGAAITQYVDVTVDVAADVPPTTAPPTTAPPTTAPPTTSPSTPPAAGGESGGSLPQTGVEIAGPAIALAALLLLAGAGLVLRRRRSL